MLDPLGPILAGKVALDDGLAAWLRNVLRHSYPEVFNRVGREVDGFGRWTSLPWWVVREAFEAAETDPDARLDWEAACALVDALTHPLEKLDEAVQATRAAILGLHAYAERKGPPELSASAIAHAQSLALAFATIDVMDEGYDLAAATRGWLAKVRPPPVA